MDSGGSDFEFENDVEFDLEFDAKQGSPTQRARILYLKTTNVNAKLGAAEKARVGLLVATQTYMKDESKKSEMESARKAFDAAISEVNKLRHTLRESGGGNHAGSAVNNNGRIIVRAGLAKLRVTSTEIDARTRRRSTAKTSLGFGDNIRFGADVTTIYLSVENGRTFTFARKASDVPFRVNFEKFNEERARDAQRLQNYAVMAVNNTPSPEALKSSVQYFNRIARFASNVTFLQSGDELRSVEYIVQSIRAEMALLRNTKDPSLLQRLSKRLVKAETKLRRLRPTVRRPNRPLIQVLNSQPMPNIINTNAISNISEVNYAASNDDMERRIRDMESKNNTTISTLMNKLESLERQCAEERAKSDSMKSQIDKCKMESKERNRLSKEVSSLKEQIEDAITESESIRQSNVNLESERNKLMDEVNRLQMEAEDRRKKKNSGPPGMQPEDRIRALRKRLAETESKLKSTKNEMDELEVEKLLLERDRNKEATEKAKIIQKNKELLDDLDDKGDLLDKLNRELVEKTDMEDELNNLKKQLRDKDNELASVRLRAGFVEILPGYELDTAPLSYYDAEKFIVKNGIEFPEEDVLPIPNLASIKRLLNEKLEPDEEKRRTETLKKVYGATVSTRVLKGQINKLEKFMSTLNENSNLTEDALTSNFEKYKSAVMAFLNSLKKYPKQKSGVPMSRRSSVNSMIHIARMMSSRRTSIYSDSDSDEDEDGFEELPSRQDVVDMFDTTTIVSTVAGMINSDKPMDLSKLKRSETSGYYGTAQDMDLERMINDSSRWESESVESFEMTDDDMDDEW